MQRDYFNCLTMVMYGVHVVETFETNMGFDSNMFKGFNLAKF